MTTLGPGQVGHFAPSFLPDGRRFLFSARGAPDTTGIYLGSLDSPDTHRLTATDTVGVYLPAGWLLWARAGTLVAQRLDLQREGLSGDPVTLADGVAPFDSTSNTGGAVSVATTGLVAYRTGAGSRRQLTWFDRSGTARGTIGDPDGDDLRDPRVSPDGRRVVVSRTSRLTFDAAAQDARPVWSPDRTRIVYRSFRSGRGDLYQKLASGAGGEQRFMTFDQTKTPSNWSADGRFLLYQSADPLTGNDLWVVPMAGDHPSSNSGRPEPVEGRTPSVFRKTPFSDLFGAFSPNGQWVADPCGSTAGTMGGGVLGPWHPEETK